MRGSPALQPEIPLSRPDTLPTAQTPPQPPRAKRPGPATPLALLLGLIGGYTDAVVYLAMHMWVGNMTGMLVFAVLALTRYDYAYATEHFGTVFVFTGGVAAARAGRQLFRRPQTALGVPALLTAIAIPLFPGLAGFYLVAFAMGWQNGAVHNFGGASVNTVFMTGNLERLGEGVGDPDPTKGPGLIALVIVAYAAGVVAGGYAELAFPLALIPTPIGLGLIAATARWIFPQGDAA